MDVCALSSVDMCLRVDVDYERGHFSELRLVHSQVLIFFFEVISCTSLNSRT